MEIWSYLWSRRGRIAVLVLLPLLVGAGTFFVVRATSGPQVEGALELSLPTANTPGVNDAQIANFVAVAQGDAVRKALSSQFHLSAGDVKAHLTATRVDSSGTFVRVAYTSDTDKNVAAIVTAAAGEALNPLMDPEIAAAEATRNDLLAQYGKIGDDPNFQAPVIPKGFTKQQLIQQQQALILNQIGALNQQISLAMSERTAAQSAASDQAAVTLTRTSANSILLKTTLVNAGIALFAGIILLVAYDTVRPRRTPSEDVRAQRRGGRRSPRASEYPDDPKLSQEPDEPELSEEPKPSEEPDPREKREAAGAEEDEMDRAATT